MFNKMEENNKPSTSSVISAIKRRTRRIFSAEEKIQIVLECLRGEESVAAICRKYGRKVAIDRCPTRQWHPTIGFDQIIKTIVRAETLYCRFGR